MDLVTQKMSELQLYWDEQTHGIHLGPEGRLLNRDGTTWVSPEEKEKRRSKRKSAMDKRISALVDQVSVIRNEIQLNLN